MREGGRLGGRGRWREGKALALRASEGRGRKELPGKEGKMGRKEGGEGRGGEGRGVEGRGGEARRVIQEGRGGEGRRMMVSEDVRGDSRGGYGKTRIGGAQKTRMEWARENTHAGAQVIEDVRCDDGDTGKRA